jgi:hypothetical protein
MRSSFRGLQQLRFGRTEGTSGMGRRRDCRARRQRSFNGPTAGRNVKGRAGWDWRMRWCRTGSLGCGKPVSSINLTAHCVGSVRFLPEPRRGSLDRTGAEHAARWTLPERKGDRSPRFRKCRERGMGKIAGWHPPDPIANWIGTAMPFSVFRGLSSFWLAQRTSVASEIEKRGGIVVRRRKHEQLQCGFRLAHR